MNNNYQGRRLGLWLLAAVRVVKVVQIVSVMIDGRRIVSEADGIPLNTFSTEATRTIVAAFMGMGISRLLICTICAIVLLRYRSAVTLMFTLLAVHDVARELVLRPVRSGTPVGMEVNIALIVLTAAGVALSLARRRQPGN
ncbi:MAG: hypothetical protein V7647_4147 [Acidobacteriota bacterium]|jgi:hypothetical protein